ncbi:A24 family peptidase [Gordonia sp. HY002]|uniref:prepilin peptidase n=1 Tax=Gordonia zhenghanii TaxID=2911516 RepID=UPI001EF08ED9|nr:A24 family peptidase [Gordonia zhenghanii]MCF8569747.1 A24 family peptidase [Gordonia zhenghanii]MCF8603219.1 A24 family peptidase [Gordonia zhenghanii]
MDNAVGTGVAVDDARLMPFVTLVLVAVSVVCAVIDARTGRIPNAITLPAIGLVVAVGVVAPSVLIAGLACGAVYLCAFVFRACGGGDVKLAVVVGGAVGIPAAALLTVVLAAVLSLAVSAVTRRRVTAHGPALVGAAVLLGATVLVVR